jgi:hypothetical protein
LRWWLRPGGRGLSQPPRIGHAVRIGPDQPTAVCHAKVAELGLLTAGRGWVPSRRAATAGSGLRRGSADRTGANLFSNDLHGRQSVESRLDHA